MASCLAARQCAAITPASRPTAGIARREIAGAFDLLLSLPITFHAARQGSREQPRFAISRIGAARLGQRFFRVRHRCPNATSVRARSTRSCAGDSAGPALPEPCRRRGRSGEAPRRASLARHRGIAGHRRKPRGIRQIILPALRPRQDRTLSARLPAGPTGPSPSRGNARTAQDRAALPLSPASSAAPDPEQLRALRSPS